MILSTDASEKAKPGVMIKNKKILKPTVWAWCHYQWEADVPDNSSAACNSAAWNFLCGALGTLHSEKNIAFARSVAFFYKCCLSKQSVATECSLRWGPHFIIDVKFGDASFHC